MTRKIPTANANMLVEDDASDAALVKAIQNGDKRLADKLCRRYLDFAISVASRILTNQEDVEDAAQNGLQSAIQKLDGFKGESSFKTWLRKIILNSAYLVRRHNRSRNRAHLSYPLPLAPRNTCPDEIVRQELSEAIEEILAVCSAEQCDIFHQYAEKGNVRKVAATLNLAEATVQIELDKVLYILAKRLRQLGWSSP